jgi:lipopolysaccharide export system protein LptA
MALAVQMAAMKARNPIARRLLPALAGAALLWAGPGQAQMFNPSAPVNLAAGSVEVNEAAGTVVYKGAVELTQGDRRLRADTLSIFLRQGGGGGGAGLALGDIDRLEASGHVFYVTAEQTVRGDNAVYYSGTDTLVVSGQVVIVQGENVLTGARLTVNNRTKQTTLEPGGGGRIRTIYYPDSKPAPAQ